MDRRKEGERGEQESLCFSIGAVYTPFMRGAYRIFIHSILSGGGGGTSSSTLHFGDGFGFAGHQVRDDPMESGENGGLGPRR